MNRVVITGLGVVSSTGIGHHRFWSNLTAGRSGIGHISLFDASQFPVRIGGEVKDFQSDCVLEHFPQAVQTRDRKVLLGLSAARQAVEDAGLSEEILQHALLSVGTGLEMFHLADLAPAAHASDVSRTILNSLAPSPTQTQCPLDETATQLGSRYGFRAGKYTNCSACAAGAQAIGEAWNLLCSGYASLALAGATDSMLNPLGLGGFSLLRVLSDENDAPQQACRPFDATRKGTVLAEGAAFLVLETLDHARLRDAEIYAEILGYSSSLDAFRVSDPDNTGAGAVQSMRQALDRAGLRPQDIDLINAHGTGTPKNDPVEISAIKTVLGAHAYKIPVHAVKSMTGHMIAASSAAEAVAAALTLHNGIIPPTINLNQPDPECDLDIVCRPGRAFQGDTVLSNSFGFGGQNATLIFGSIP